MSIPESGMEKVGLVWPCLSAILIAEIVTACVNSLNGAILFFNTFLILLSRGILLYAKHSQLISCHDMDPTA